MVLRHTLAFPPRPSPTVPAVAGKRARPGACCAEKGGGVYTRGKSTTRKTRFPRDAIYSILTPRGEPMAFRPNYRAERAQKSRAKDEKKQEKLKRLEEASAKRKALREG